MLPVSAGCCSGWVQAGGEPPVEGHEEVGLRSFNFTNIAELEAMLVVGKCLTNDRHCSGWC